MKITGVSLAIMPLLAFVVGMSAQDFFDTHSTVMAATRFAGPGEKRQNAVDTPYLMYAEVIGVLKRDYYNPELDTTQLTYSGIRGMMGSLHDHYTRYLDPTEYAATVNDSQGGFVGIGAIFKINKLDQAMVVHVLPQSPAHFANVMSGDIILKVNHQNAAALKGEDVTNLLLGAPDTKVKLTLRRKNVRKPVVVTITRRVVRQEVVRSVMLDSVNKIGYVSLQAFNDESDPQLSKALTALNRKGMRALVFDLRSNPGGLVPSAQRVASRFIASGPVVWIKDIHHVTQKNVIPSLYNRQSQYPLVVLVNGKSASAAEIVSGAIKDTHSGLLVGEKTFGKGIVQSIFGLDDGSAAVITTDHYFTPKHHDINHKGIEPDITVTLSETDQRNLTHFLEDHPESVCDLNYDRQLQRAVTEARAQIR